MIQIDMPMPDRCGECPLNYDFCNCEGMTDEEWAVHDDAWNAQVCEGEHRPEYCPLKEQPEIVRCKDCIHYRHYDLSSETVSECKIDHCENPDADWFCADGERRCQDDSD